MDSAGPVAEWVRALDEARRTAEPVDLNRELANLEAETAYRVQQAGVARRAAGAAGEAGIVAGYKIGWASPEARQAQGIPEPIFGRLLAADVVSSGGEVARGSLIRPAIEGELVVVVERAFAVNAAPKEIRAACRLTVGFDLMDSRLCDGAATWRAGIADNCGAARVVLGGKRAEVPAAAALAGVEVTLRRNGEVAASGGGARIEGPEAALAWLARKLAGQGETLRPGQFVFLGAVAGPVPVAAGEIWQVEAAGFGEASVRIV